MTRDWESTFAQWATPPGKTEQDRLENVSEIITLSKGFKWATPVQTAILAITSLIARWTVMIIFAGALLGLLI